MKVEIFMNLHMFFQSELPFIAFIKPVPITSSHILVNDKE